MWSGSTTSAAGLEKGHTRAVVAVSQAEAMAAATAGPSVCEEVWRNANRQIFVGLRVDLAKVSARHLQELIEDAWRSKAPKRLPAVAQAPRQRAFSSHCDVLCRATEVPEI